MIDAGVAFSGVMALALSLSGHPPLHAAMTVDLCSGGKMTIDLDGNPAHRKAPDNRCSKACHAGDRRKRFGPSASCSY